MIRLEARASALTPWPFNPFRHCLRVEGFFLLNTLLGGKPCPALLGLGMEEKELKLFMSRTLEDPDTGCWLWQLCLNAYGYGCYRRKRIPGNTTQAHRIAYEHFRGPIPRGLQIDHLCRNRACVNPDHLEAVTPKENCRRGKTGANNRSKTHCKHGHEFTPENTYRRRYGDGLYTRICRTCSRARERRKYARRKARAQASA